jgi:HEAT repeat protein
VNRDDPADLERVLRHAAATGDRDSGARWKIVGDVHKRADRAAFDVVYRFATSPDAAERALACDILGQIGYSANRPFADETLPVLIAACADVDADVVDAAVSSLGHLGDDRALSTILRHVAHPTAEVRLSVAAALPFVAGDPPAETAVRALIQLSADADGDVRDWATMGIGSQLTIDRDDVRDALVARLADEEGDTAGEALLGLALRHDPRALPALLERLDRDPGNLIVEAAAELGAPEALPVLVRLKENGWEIDDPRPSVLDAAIEACSQRA